MQIDKVVVTPKGKIRFKGEITQEEHDFLIEFALNILVSQGALPFIKDRVEEVKEESIITTPGVH